MRYKLQITMHTLLLIRSNKRNIAKVNAEYELPHILWSIMILIYIVDSLPRKSIKV